MRLLWLPCLLILVLFACDQKEVTDDEIFEDTDPPIATIESGGDADEPVAETPEVDGSRPRLMQYSRAVVRKMVGKLDEKDDKLRQMALMSLPADPGHYVGEPAILDDVVIPALVAILGRADETEMMRGTVVLKLCAMGDRAGPAMPALIAALDDDKMRLHVASWIPKLGATGKPALPALRRRLEVAKPNEKPHLARAIERLEAAE